MSIQQLRLFPDSVVASEFAIPEAQTSELTAESPLNIAIEHFHDHMVQQEFATNTIKAFLGDLGILKRYLKADPPVAQISASELQGFLDWLLYERGKPCSPKSHARRLTTLKVFFAWLADLAMILDDPSASLAHKPVKTSLPQVLTERKVENVLSTASQMMAAEKPDPRPSLLVSLLLNTGIKKGECMGIRLAHIDTSNPEEPRVHIRYENPRMEHKERRLPLPPDWPKTLAEYLDAYEPQDALFPCTARNLEYVLANLAKEAGLPEGLSFEMLRWTCAVRDYQDRMDPDHLRRKLGLSEMSWRETKARIVRLAESLL